MNDPQAEVWILHRSRQVLCQVAGLGVPVAAVQSSDGTVGGTYFRADDYLGPYPMPEGSWGEAGEVAKAKAAELGYGIEYFDPWLDVGEDDVWSEHE
jgi:hypothetical protein